MRWRFTALSREAFHGPCGGSIDLDVGVSRRFRGKHFSALAGEASTYYRCFTALSREAFHSVVVDGKHQRMLAFLSAFAGSISRRRCGREASAHAGISQRLRGKHFAASLWTGSISVCWEEFVCFCFCFCVCVIVCILHARWVFPPRRVEAE